MPVSRAAKRKHAAGQDSRAPYIMAAVMCELARQDKDETMSAIRIVDRFQIDGRVQVVEAEGVDLSDAYLPFRLSFTILIMLKAFPKPGIQTITLQPYGPNGASIGEEIPVDLTVNGIMLGANLRMQSDLTVAESGIHWMSVRYRGRELTRMTFEVEDRRTRERISETDAPDPTIMVYRKRDQRP